MTRTVQTHEALLACQAHVAAVLGGALRAWRDPEQSYDEWVAGIVDAVALGANEWAVLHDYGQVTVEDVARCDRSAAGHADYHHKFSLRVADLIVYGADDERP